MSQARKQIRLKSAGTNSRRKRPTLREALQLADSHARAAARANRRSGRRELKSIRAAIAGTLPVEESQEERPGLLLRLSRWVLGLLLVPLCAVTTWTFFNQLSQATQHSGFWTSTSFWYFATGALLMTGWFATGLLWKFFLYLYVLGHELTHVLFILLFFGKISEWSVSTEGGFVTTNKSNILISLAPYFVPLWATVVLLEFALFGLVLPLSPAALKALYALTGFFWAFHLLWTMWMIPHDQPDLRDNGTFLSLAIVYLANLMILIALTIFASPAMTFLGFAREWLQQAESFARQGHALVLTLGGHLR